MLKAPNVKMLSKKNDLHPFEDEQKIEFLTSKNDTSLFLVGSNTKKRPNNIVMVNMCV
jgi:ribosome production factor 2